jgi:hypothetical protein
MRTIDIRFPHQQARCVFPQSREDLTQAAAELNLSENYPVIVLIGGYIQDQHAEATQKAIEVIAGFAETNRALVICGASDLGVMASIGHTRTINGYSFPLLGINLNSMVTWPNGPRNQRFLWWGKKRWPLSSGYSHLMLVPGEEYGDDSPWIDKTAIHLSQGYKSVTILANGGSVSRKDVALSLEHARPVIVLAGTGRLADEMANQPAKPTWVMTVQAEDENALRQAIESTISIHKENMK